METTQALDKSFHSTVIWRIHNYFETLVEQNTTIESPEFITNYLGGIKWQLAIIAKRYDGEKNVTECILRRSPSCSGPTHIDLKVGLGLMDSKGEEWDDMTQDFRSYADTEITLRTRSIFDGVSNITASAFVDGINISCDILQDIPLRFNESDVDEDWWALSNDLKVFYRSCNLRDLILKVDEESFSVHCSIVKARCPRVARILNENGRLPEIDLTEVCSVPFIKGLIEYWYSAELGELPRIPNCSSADEIKIMEQHELKPYVYPELIGMTTTFRVSNTSVSWVIEDIQFCEDLRHLQTDIVHVYKCDDLPWKLHIYPKGTRGDADYFTLDIIEEENVCFKIAYVELFLKDEDGSEYCHKRQTARPGKPRKYVFSVFMKHDEFSSKCEVLLMHNILRIGCRIIYPTGDLIQDITAIRPVEDLTLKIEHPYINLVKDMKNLYTSQDMSDISLKSGDKTFKVHSAILAARSRHFKYMFSDPEYKTSKSRIIKLDDVEPDDLERILKYIYYAEKIVLNTDLALKLYPVFKKYNITSLENVCSAYLQNNITVLNVVDIGDLAKKFDIKPLKRAIRQFSQEY